VKDLRLLLDRRLWSGPAPLCFGILVAANLCIWHLERGLEESRRANLLSLSASIRAPGPPRYDWSIGEDPGRYWGEIPDARRAPLVVVSGMSQMYAINDPHPGDEIIVEHLDDALAPHGVRAFGFAAPNMNNEEALLYLVAATLEERTSPAAFVYGVCFDKFRNVDLRPGLSRFLAQRPALREAWARVCATRSARYPMACAKIEASLQETATSSAQAERDDFEHELRAALGRVLPMIADGADLNAKAQMDIYILRNWLLRIKASTKRPMLESTYRLNQEFLGLIADESKEKGIVLVLYVIPLNPMAENPYVPQQYEEFKSWIQAFATERGLPFANLEDVVPHDDWGLSNGEPDFKHFTERGHALTASAILERFGPALEHLAAARHDFAEQ
jgi:hypothetical protein